MPHQMPQFPGVRHRFVDIADRKIHVAEAGQPDENPPVVLVHDWPQHWFAWRFVMEILGESRHVVALDRRGLGWSEIAWTEMGQDELADNLAATLDELGLRDPWLVGHGWGAWIAGISASREPDRYSGLTAVAGPLPWMAARKLRNPWKHRYYRPLALPGIGPHLIHFHTAPSEAKQVRIRLPRRDVPLSPGFRIRGYTDRMIGRLRTDGKVLNKRMRDRYARETRAWTRARAAVYQFRDVFKTGLKRAAGGEYPRPDIPVTVVVGDKDRIWHAGDYRVGKDVDSIAIAAKAGHFVPEEDPQAIADAIRAPAG